MKITVLFLCSFSAWGQMLSAVVGDVHHSGGPAMSISLIAHTFQGGSAPTTSAQDTTGASLLIIGTSTYSNAAPVVSDNKGNTWHQLPYQSAGGNSYEIFFYAWNPIVGPGHTFTGDAFTYGLLVAAFSGIVISSDPLDQFHSDITRGGDTTNPGSITPTGAGALVVSVMGGSVSASVPTVDAPLTVSDSVNYVAGVNYAGGLAWYVQSSPTAINPTWRTTGSSQAGATVASFKAASAIMGTYAIPTANGLMLTVAVPNLPFYASITLSAAQQAVVQGWIQAAQNTVEAGLVAVGVITGTQGNGL